MFFSIFNANICVGFNFIKQYYSFAVPYKLLLYFIFIKIINQNIGLVFLNKIICILVL